MLLETPSDPTGLVETFTVRVPLPEILPEKVSLLVAVKCTPP